MRSASIGVERRDGLLACLFEIDSERYITYNDEWGLRVLIERRLQRWSTRTTLARYRPSHRRRVPTQERGRYTWGICRRRVAGFGPWSTAWCSVGQTDKQTITERQTAWMAVGRRSVQIEGLRAGAGRDGTKRLAQFVL